MYRVLIATTTIRQRYAGAMERSAATSGLHLYTPNEAPPSSGSVQKKKDSVGGRSPRVEGESAGQTTGQGKEEE